MWNIALFVINSSFTACVATQTIASPIVDYRFSCDPDGNSRVSGKSVLGDLVGLSSTHCNYHNYGISSLLPVYANQTIRTMQKEFTDASGFAVEVWITPLSEYFQSKSEIIFAIGGLDSLTEINNDEEDEYFACSNDELYLAVRGNLLEFGFLDSYPIKSCRYKLIRQKVLQNNVLVQVFLTFILGKTNVYIDGELIVAEAPNRLPATLSTWNPDSKLKLFASQFGAARKSFQGTLHQISIFNESVSDDEIFMRYENERLLIQESLLTREPLRLVADSEPVTVIQGRSSPISVGGLNSSTSEYLVQVEFTKLPIHGNLLSEWGPIRMIGFRLDLSHVNGESALFYRSWSKTTFTQPRLSYSGVDLGLDHEFFEYRLVATDKETKETLGWSSVVRKEIVVRHVNQAPTMVLPEAVSLPPDQSVNPGDRPVAYLTGARLDDPDRNIDRIRVDIWAYNGSLALLKYHELADFSPRANRSRGAWQCQGIPNGSRNMTFLAEPDSVTLIFSVLQYIAFNWNEEDKIVVRIYDGSGQHCLDETEHKYDSIHEGCFEITAEVHVPAIPLASREFDIREITLLQVSFFLLTLIPFMAFCCVVQCFCKHCVGRKKRGATRDDRVSASNE